MQSVTDVQVLLGAPQLKSFLPAAFAMASGGGFHENVNTTYLTNQCCSL